MPGPDPLGNSNAEGSCRCVEQEEPGHFWSWEEKQFITGR